MKKFVSVLLALGMLSTSVVFAEFDDVSEANIYSDSVDFLEAEEVLTGNTDGTLGYYDPINRAELLTIISRAVDVQLDTAQWIAYDSDECFSDVAQGKWYTKHVCYAEDVEWVGGYDDGSFRPTDPVNFVEALKILAKAFDIDYDENSSPWYKDLVEESSDKMFIPLTIGEFGQEITKGEMSDLVGRVLKFKAGELDEWIGEGSEYVVTYEMLKNKDSFFLDGLDGIWDEPGEVFKRMVKGFGISDCGGFGCFDDKFQKCETAYMEFTSLFVKTLDIVIGYEIEGSEDGDCYVKTHFVSGYGGEWDGKDMSCRYDNDKGFGDASEEIASLGHENVCEGDLLEYFEENYNDDDDDDEVPLNDDEDCFYSDDGYGFYIFYPCDWTEVDSLGFLSLKYSDAEPPCENCGYIKDEVVFKIVDTSDMVAYFSSQMEFVDDYFENEVSGNFGYRFDGSGGMYGIQGQIVELADGKALYFTGPTVDEGIDAVDEIIENISLTPYAGAVDEEEFEIISYEAGDTSIALAIGGIHLEPGQHYNYACGDGFWFDIPAQVESYGDSTTITNLRQDTNYTCTVSVHNDSHVTVDSSDSIWTSTSAKPDQLSVISTSISISDVLTIEFEDIGEGNYYSADCDPGLISTFEDSDAYDPPAQSGSSNEFTFTDLTPGGTIYRCHGSASGDRHSAEIYYETYD